MLKAILAIDRDGAIGWKDGRLPWHLPEDLKRFKALTMGHTVVMGYNTFKSLNRPFGLPGRSNVVLTSRPEQEFEEGVCVIRSIEDLTQVVGYDQLSGRETWVIGGAQLYDALIDNDYLDELWITLVDASSGADVRLNHELNFWKHFVLHEREAYGIEWVATHVDPQPTHTYLTLVRVRSPST